MKNFVTIPLLMSTMIYAMEKESHANTMPKSKLEDLALEKKQVLKNARENLKFIVKHNLPTCFENAYNSYKELGAVMGFDELMENPYALIAEHLKGAQLSKLVNILNKNGYSVDSCIGYAEWIGDDKAVNYSKLNPIGYAIEFDNENLLIALHMLNANLRATASEVGKKYSVLNSPAVCVPENKYNSFEYAIRLGHGKLAEKIYHYDNKIVNEGNPLKVAIQLAAQDVSTQTSLTSSPSIFTFVHNLVVKHKPLLNHSLLEDVCIKYCHAGLVAEMFDLGYSIDATPKGNLFSLFNTTITNKVINLFKDINANSFEAMQIAALIVVISRNKKFNKDQEDTLTKLIKERLRVDSPQFNGNMSEDLKKKIRNSKEYDCASFIVSMDTKVATF